MTLSQADAYLASGTQPLSGDCYRIPIGRKQSRQLASHDSLTIHGLETDDNAD